MRYFWILMLIGWVAVVDFLTHYEYNKSLDIWEPRSSPFTYQRNAYVPFDDQNQVKQPKGPKP